MDITHTTTIPQYNYDNRSRMGKLLAAYDASYERKNKAKQVFEELEAEHDTLVDAIKAEAANLGLDTADGKLNLDHPKLAYILRLGHGSRTLITEAGKHLLQTQHPKLWAQITESIPVTSLRRLTGKQWAKKEAAA